MAQQTLTASQTMQQVTETVETGFTSFDTMGYKIGKLVSFTSRFRIDAGLSASYKKIFLISQAPIKEFKTLCVITSIDDGALIGYGELKIATNGEVFARAIGGAIGQAYCEMMINTVFIVS